MYSHWQVRICLWAAASVALLYADFVILFNWLCAKWDFDTCCKNHFFLDVLGRTTVLKPNLSEKEKNIYSITLFLKASAVFSYILKEQHMDFTAVCHSGADSFVAYRCTFVFRMRRQRRRTRSGGQKSWQRGRAMPLHPQKHRGCLIICYSAGI